MKVKKEVGGLEGKADFIQASSSYSICSRNSHLISFLSYVAEQRPKEKQPQTKLNSISRLLQKTICLHTEKSNNAFAPRGNGDAGRVKTITSSLSPSCRPLQ
jgi:hypothetical protein